MDNSIPTAEEFLERNFVKDYLVHNDEGLPHSPLGQLLQGFAKLHVKAALKAASEKATGTPMYDFSNKYKAELVEDNVNIDEESILTAYPTHNIK